MAKEKFERTKPHVNVGTIGHHEVLDAAASLTVMEAGPTTGGNPDEYMILSIDAPPASVPDSVAVAYPIDDTFVFDPATNGAAVSIDFLVDVFPTTIEGTADVDITLAIIQDEPFIFARGATPSVDGSEDDWTTLGQSGLVADDFRAVDGGLERPDFSRPFQFGYAFSGEFSSEALSVELGLDNMAVEITTVPEPSSLVLAMAMGATFCWHRWRGGDDKTDG